MSNNRTEQQAGIDGLTQIVDLIELKPALIQDGYVFKKDVIASVVGTSGNIALSFAASDQIVSTIIADANYSISGLEDGQIGKLVVNKTSSAIVTFAGVDIKNISQQVGLTKIAFEILYLNGLLVVTQLNRCTSGIIPATDIVNPYAPTFNASGKWNIVDNMAFVDVQFTTNPVLGSETSFIIDITLPFAYDIQLIPVCSYLSKGGVVTSATLQAGLSTIFIQCVGDTLFISESYQIKLSYTLKIK